MRISDWSSDVCSSDLREQLTVALADGREVTLLRVRDPRARRMRLSVSERGVRLTLPRAVSLRAANAFVAEHGDWLIAQLDRLHAVAAPTPLARGASASLPLRGEQLPLIWCEGRYARAELEPHGIRLSLPAAADDSRVRLALREFYLAQARADVGRWLARYLPHFRDTPRRIRRRALARSEGPQSELPHIMRTSDA